MDFEKQGKNQSRDEKKRRIRRRKTEEFQSDYGFELRSMGKCLPEDITLDIFSRLPAESVLQCKLVCRNWQTVLGSTYFTDIHLKQCLRLLQLDDDDHNYYDSNINGGGCAAAKVPLGILFSFRVKRDPNVRLYYGNYGEMNNINEQYFYKSLTMINHPPTNKPNGRCDPIGSCNGLICFALTDFFIYVCQYYNPVYICNPITREYVNLPRLEESFEAMVCGYGYHPSSGEYKVVRIYYYPNQLSTGHVQVYTLGDGSGWRDKGKIEYNLPPYGLLYCGTFVNGALHWLDCKERKILGFNLANEEFNIVPSPPCFLPNGYNPPKHCFYLRELGRHLSVVHQVRGERVDIWSLKKLRNTTTSDRKEQEYYRSATWSREFSIPWEGCESNNYEPFTLTKSGEVLLLYNDSILSRYDPKTATIKKLVNDDRSLENFQAIPHMNSLVSLKTLGEKNCKTRRRYMCKDKRVCR